MARAIACLAGQAREQTPKIPAIAAQLERKFDAVKEKFGKVRAQQLMTDHGLVALREEVASAKAAAEAAVKTAAGATSIVELEMQKFVAENIHPDAAAALREFASQALAAQNERVAPVHTIPTTNSVSCVIENAAVLENWPEGGTMNVSALSRR